MSNNKEESNKPTHSSGSRPSDSTPHDHQPSPADPKSSVNGDDTSSTKSSDGNFNTKDFTPIDIMGAPRSLPAPAQLLSPSEFNS
ncbi:hypothetical protein BFJ66_g15569 [Fusarium oxysporum f. sp. cepae]|uniref:Uncharacterized protein n=1 Tax=Fusarium oxysporum f. sp. cepae TaxID=396571 RepID=A0A3L6NCZ1_FUSOX|nr:hypothetical protein QWA68_014241 [Fusarium oxysporum]RKK14850.1 hypothetical protein BFJ65_g11399 [Fusarium oxysporum f. sp. cepae]RKK23446.1 hypothetical protein BFJ67_g17176 [Fusarium oxysporum f. sp. cepae]RKK32048.1 hypothetical protein BFJ66_g15569 [Fusarium oxysporum f. sp. cepae]